MLKSEKSTSFFTNKASSKLTFSGIIKGYFDPSYDLVGIIEKRIRYSNDKRIFEQIVRDVNKQNKEYGAVTPRVIKNFEALLDKLLLAESEEKKLEKVEGVLFYAKP